MARIKLSSEKNNNPVVKKIFNEIKKAKGFVPAPYRVFARLPHVLEANWNKTKSVHGQGRISGLLKDEIAMAVSTANNCEFCIYIHRAGLKKHELSDKEIDQIAKAKSKNPKTDFVLKFVVKATKDPHQLADKDFKKLRDFGYSEEDILEILTVMEMYTGYNKIIPALNIQVGD